MQHLLPIFLLLVATLFASCRSSHHMVAEATATADTLHTTHTTQHTTVATTADTTAVSTHTSTFAYLIERTVIDSTGKVQHRTLERGTFTSRRADTTATAHRAASTITSDTTIRTSCASRSSSTTTTQTASAPSLRDKFTALLMLALIVAVCVMGARLGIRLLRRTK